MAKFLKKIVSAGVYHVKAQDGKTREEMVTPTRLEHWSQEFNRYKANGNQLPAPWSHTDETGVPVRVGPNGTITRSDINAGFWDRLFTKPDEKGIPSLYGEVDVPGDPNDPNSPAGKVGKTVRETSLFATPKFVDGKGNEYNDVILHAALVTHPIEPGQSNFQLLNDNSVSLAMSHCVYEFAMGPYQPAEEQPGKNNGQGGMGAQTKPGMGSQHTAQASGASIQQVIQALRQCGIDLPDDTTPENLFERLLVACRQKATSEGTGGEGDVFTQPEGAEPKSPVPVAMSQNFKPEDFAKIPNDVLMAHPVVQQLKSANDSLLAMATNSAKTAYSQRVVNLVSSGRTTQEYADKNLKPLVDGFAMSHGGTNPLEIILTNLEALPARTQPAQAAASLLMGTAMSHPTHSPENPYMGAIGPSGQPLSAADIIKRFNENTINI